MAFIKLFIATSPYMALGANAEKCLGPGICAGHGMPADTAVVQFPNASPETFLVPSAGAGHGMTGVGTGQFPSAVCPGPGICPGAATCPSCKKDVLHQIRSPSVSVPPGQQQPVIGTPLALSASNENLILKNAHSVILLPKDLDDLRQRVRVSFNFFHRKV